MDALPDALYEPDDGGLLIPTALTRGPWDPRHQHAGPPSALLARAVEQAAGIEGGRVARIAIDILRPVPLEPLRVEARLLRPGRRVEQVESVMTLAADGTELMRARAWRMRDQETHAPSEAARIDPPPPGPEDLPAAGRPSFFPPGQVAYFDALEWRFASGVFDAPGPAAVWSRLRAPLVAGEQATPVEHLLVMADAASGVSATLDWSTWTFVNVDLSVALEREPEGAWLAMDARTRIGDRGAGVCTGVLSDVRGRAGVSTQSLFVSSRSS
jgi:hypothetical protein